MSEYGSEGFRVRLRRLSEYASVAWLVERPTRETQAEQYSDTVLENDNNPTSIPDEFFILFHVFLMYAREVTGELVLNNIVN